MRGKSQKRPKKAAKPPVKTFRFRVKDSSTDGRALRRMARAVNQVWNYCSAAQLHALKHNQRWTNDEILQDLTRGSSRMLGISSQTIQAICEEYDLRRRQFKKAKLRFRGRKALGWIPLKTVEQRQVQRRRGHRHVSKPDPLQSY